MKHSRIDYKNDIKVLGRVVSIATENKVAEAEQIFDTTFQYGDGPEGMNQYDINRLFKDAIVDILSNINTLNGKIGTLESCCQDVQRRLTALENGNTPEPTPATKYTLTYKDGSTILGTQQYEAGATITPITSPTKDGYTFAGWNGLPNTMPANNLTVTAKWNKNVTPQPTSWVLNVSPISVSADVDEEFTITATDGTTNGGMNNIMIPSVPSGLTLVGTQPNGTNPLSKKFTFKGASAGTRTIAVVGMANDIEVARKQVSVTISDVEVPQEPEYELRITATNNNTDLTVGDTTNLIATIVNVNDSSDIKTELVEWYPSNNAISVNSTGIMTATITAMSASSGVTVMATTASGLSGQLTFKVASAELPEEPVYELQVSGTGGHTYDGDRIVLRVGENANIVAKIVNVDDPTDTKEEEISWSASSDAVTVENTFPMHSNVIGVQAANNVIVTATSASGLSGSISFKINEAEYDLSLDPAQLLMLVGDDPQGISAIRKTNGIVNTEGRVSWSSSDDSIATVDRGYVTAVGAGNATVTATWILPTDETVATATCAVEVTQNHIQPQSVTITCDQYEIVNGKVEIPAGTQNVVFTAVIAPSDADINTDITWTVLDGVGDYTIDGNRFIYSALDRSSICNVKASTQNDLHDQILIDVVAEEPQETHIYTFSISPKSMSLTAGGDTDSITPTIHDNGTDMNGQTVTWSSSDPTIATVSNGIVTPIAEGPTAITATWNDPDGVTHTDTCNVVVVAAEQPEQYSINVVEPITNITVGGDPAHVRFYVLPETNDNRHWTYFVPNVGAEGIHGESLNEGIVNIDPANAANNPDGIIYTVYGIIATDDELSNARLSWETWTVTDWNNTTLPKASNTFKVVTYPAEEVPPTPANTHDLIFYDTGLQEDTHALDYDGPIQRDTLVDIYYPNTWFEVGRAQYTAGNPTSDPTLESLIATIDEQTVKDICLQHGIDRSNYRLSWDLGGYYYNWPDSDTYIKAVWIDDEGEESTIGTTKTYTFTFNNPELLNPSITRGENEGDSVNVQDKAFKSSDEDLILSFDYYQDQYGNVTGHLPAQIVTNTVEGDSPYEPNLRINREGGITLYVGMNNAKIQSIKIPAAYIIGSLAIYESSPYDVVAEVSGEGYQSVSLELNGQYYCWNNTGSKNISSITLYNRSALVTRIGEIEVTYERIS